MFESHKNVVCYENYRDDHLGHIVDLEIEHSLLYILPNVLATFKISVHIDHAECLLQIGLAFVITFIVVILLFKVIAAIDNFLTAFVAARKL